MSGTTGDTTVSVSRETLNRLKANKPMESGSYDEFINDALDAYEEKQ